MAIVKREVGALTPAKKKVAAAPAEGFTLPTKKTVPVDELLGYIILLFGEKKIGKTTMLAEGGDSTFFAFFEPGGKALSLFASNFQNWGQFKLAVSKLVTETPRRFNHVVVDTVDRAYAMSEKSTYKRMGISHASDEAYGKGWAAVREDFEEPIIRLVNAGIAVTFVSHADEKEVTMRDGTKYDKLMPTMPKQARGLVEGLVDIWVYYGYDGKQRVLTIQGDDHIAAGHRLTSHFRAPDGTPLREIVMGASAAEAYKNFNDAFHNRYTPKRVPTEEAPTPTAPRKMLKKTTK